MAKLKYKIIREDIGQYLGLYAVAHSGEWNDVFEKNINEYIDVMLYYFKKRNIYNTRAINGSCKVGICDFLIDDGKSHPLQSNFPMAICMSEVL